MYDYHYHHYWAVHAICCLYFIFYGFHLPSQGKNRAQKRGGGEQGGLVKEEEEEDKEEEEEEEEEEGRGCLPRDQVRQGSLFTLKVSPPGRMGFFNKVSLIISK